MKNFRKKTVYITGGSSGIGLSTAVMLAERGAHVMIFARGKERLERAMETISGHGAFDDQRFSHMPLDVSDHAVVEAVMAGAMERFGAPDLLVNCAGRAYPRHFEDIPFAQLDETMKINFYGVWNTVAALLPHMREKGGHIVNVSSIAGFMGVFGYTDYCASKFAVVGFSEALKSEVKRYGISVSVLCPPDTLTPGFEVENTTKPEETRAISANVAPMGPDKVAEALIKGVIKETFLIIPGLDGKFTHLIKRLFPWLVDFVMSRTIRKVQT